jgi:hypothetical protein
MSDVSQRQPNSFGNVRTEMENTNKESLFVGVYPSFLPFGCSFWRGLVKLVSIICNTGTEVATPRH